MGLLCSHYSQPLLRQRQRVCVFIHLPGLTVFRAATPTTSAPPTPPKNPIKAEYNLGQKPRVLSGQKGHWRQPLHPLPRHIIL